MFHGRPFSEMVVGTARLQLFLAENQSLKGKRKVVKSLIDRIKSRFNVAMAEVGAQNLWQRIELGVTTVGNDEQFLDATFSKIVDFIENSHLAEVIDVRIDFIRYKD